MPLAMRNRAKPRRWRYSHGAIMSRMPDRGGDVHHVRRPFGAVLRFGACTGMSSVDGDSMTYQYDITLMVDVKAPSRNSAPPGSERSRSGRVATGCWLGLGEARVLCHVIRIYESHTSLRRDEVARLLAVEIDERG
jgi:hypothetical protein